MIAVFAISTPDESPSARLAILADVDRAELPLQNSRGSNQQHKEDRYQ
jgi:hypothetical protein